MAEFTLQGIDFRDLLKGCITGNCNYQEHLYHIFAPKMFGICLRYAGDYHSAEDILQEGFIKVFNNLHRFREDGSFEGWLKRIFINTAIEHYRKSIKSFRFQELDNAVNIKVRAQALPRLARQDLLLLIQNLPLGYRTVFNLYVIEGYAHKEISKMLGISEGTSKSQLARARTNLQRMIKSLGIHEAY